MVLFWMSLNLYKIQKWTISQEIIDVILQSYFRIVH